MICIWPSWCHCHLGLWLRKFQVENCQKFISIFPEITWIFYLCQPAVPSPALQSDAVKEACSWQTTRQIFMHYIHEEVTCFSTAPRNISEFEWKYWHYNLSAFANISGNFQKISGNIKFPQSLQPFCHPVISCSSKIQNGLPFCCQLTQIVLEKMALNRYSSSVVECKLSAVKSF